MKMTTIKKSILVTGVSGFVALHCIVQLLQQGYSVKTTLRSIGKKNEVLGMLTRAGTSPTPLEFIEADLTNDLNWDKFYNAVG